VGWLADRYGKVNRQHVLTAPAVGFALAVPLAIASYVMTDWRWALALLMIPTLLIRSTTAPAFRAHKAS